MMRDNWYHHWVAGATLDDQLWHQLLVMDHVLELLCGSEQGLNDAMMWTLLRCGIINASIVNKPWNGSTWSMRYLAVLVGWLWGLLAGERTRVSLHPSFRLSWSDPWLLLRGIVWNKSRPRWRRIWLRLRHMLRPWQTAIVRGTCMLIKNRHWGQRGYYPEGKLRIFWEFLNNIPSICPLGKLKVFWRFIFHFALNKPSG